jgi:hypothetical protein
MLFLHPLPANGLQVHHVAAPVLPTEYKILTTTPEGFLPHLGIGRGEIGWGQHVQHLPHRELDDCLVRRRYAAQTGGRVVPPLLVQQKCLRK